MKFMAKTENKHSGKSRAPAKAAKALPADGPILPKLREARRVCRSKLIQIKVAPELKRKAELRARSLDMDLSEYVRFLLTRDIHGFS